jgi:hypothetical protein
MVDAPLDKLPLYLRGGTVIPMLRDTIDTLSPTTVAGIESYANDPGVLFVRTAPGADQPAMTLFDNSVLVTENNVRTLKFTPGTKFTQGVMFEVIARGATAPSAVRDMSIGALTRRNTYAQLVSATEGWFFDATATGGTLWIKLPGAAVVTIEG